MATLIVSHLRTPGWGEPSTRTRAQCRPGQGDGSAGSPLCSGLYLDPADGAEDTGVQGLGWAGLQLLPSGHGRKTVTEHEETEMVSLPYSKEDFLTPFTVRK